MIGKLLRVNMLNKFSRVLTDTASAVLFGLQRRVEILFLHAHDQAVQIAVADHRQGGKLTRDGGKEIRSAIGRDRMAGGKDRVHLRNRSVRAAVSVLARASS